MKCPNCSAELGRVNGQGEPMLRTAGLVLKAEGAVMICPKCKGDVPAGADMHKALVLFMKADVKGYTRKDGVVVRPHHDTRPTDGADGWELHKERRDGSRDHRKLMHDSGGGPRFAGSPKRYAWVYEHADGEVYGRSHHGMMRKYPSVEHAKRELGAKP